MEQKKKMVLRGEAALIIAVIINSLGVFVDVAVRFGNFGNIQRAICISSGISETDIRNLDIHISGLISSFFDDYEKEICAFLLIQLCGRICIWRNDGCA